MFLYVLNVFIDIRLKHRETLMFLYNHNVHIVAVTNVSSSVVFYHK